MSSPRWTPADFKKHGWTAERALAVARRLDPEASDEHYLRASVSNPNKKVANKTVLKRLFTERKIPFEFDVFSEKIATFVDDGDVTGVLHAPSLPAGHARSRGAADSMVFWFWRWNTINWHGTSAYLVPTEDGAPAPAPTPCVGAGSADRPVNSPMPERGWTRREERRHAGTVAMKGDDFLPDCPNGC
jgi:hypothetical protein